MEFVNFPAFSNERDRATSFPIEVTVSFDLARIVSFKWRVEILFEIKELRLSGSLKFYSELFYTRVERQGGKESSCHRFTYYSRSDLLYPILRPLHIYAVIDYVLTPRGFAR